MRRPNALIPALALCAAAACAEPGPPAGDDAADTTGAAADTASPEDDAPLTARDTLTATLHDPDGAEVGTVTLTGTPNGVLVRAELDGLPAGTHAFHLHETGACAPDFGAAGGHMNPGNWPHGLLDPDGPHAGDMPNVHVPESGALTVEVFATGATIEDLTDDDGAAVVIHAGADDYRTDPAGAAGDRIACGVVEPSGAAEGPGAGGPSSGDAAAPDAADAGPAAGS